MNMQRADKIRIGCAFVGTALATFVVQPLVGGTPAIFAILGAVVGWSVAKVIVAHLETSEQAKREADATAQQHGNDADFARALRDHDKADAP